MINKISNFIDFIKQPRYFLMYAKNNKIIFISPKSLIYIGHNFFDDFFEHEYVQGRPNDSVAYNIPNVLFIKKFNVNKFESTIGVKSNAIPKAKNVGHVENESLVLLRNTLLDDSKINVRPNKGTKPNIQEIDTVKLTDGSVIMAEGNVFKKCMHTTTEPVNTADSKEISLGKNIDLTGAKSYGSIKNTNGKATFHCGKCGRFISEQ